MHKPLEMRIFHSSTSFLLLLGFVQLSLQQCYNLDGSIAPHEIPCTEFASDSDKAVPCCEAGRRCMPNSMCVSTESDTDLIRGTCTDKTWASPHCRKFCATSNKNVTIFNCTAMNGQMSANKNGYCCAAESPQCCDFQWLMWNAPDLIASATSASSLGKSSQSSAASMRSSATTPTAAGPSSASDASSASSSLLSSLSSVTSSILSSTPSSSMLSSTDGQSGTKTDISTTGIPSIVVAAPTTTPTESTGQKRDWTGVGIGAGIGAAVPLLILLIVGSLLWRRHRRRLLQKQLSSEEGASSRITKDPSIRMDRPAYLKAYEAHGVPQYELDAVRGTELPVRSPRELPGSMGERHRHQRYLSGSSNNPFELG